MILSCQHVAGQDICAGNLGENIFINGDFGSGAAMILQTDPRIALSYFYEVNPPPFDGEYTITNNSNWAFKYGTWLGIGDNSDDPNGYMMVVNADFTPGIFFEQIVDGLCENTNYAFSADIINMIMTGVSGHIDPDVSFLLDDEVFFTTGNIAKTERWNTYGFTFATEATQTEVKLTIRNNAPGGTGNDLALDNISFRACGPDANIIADSKRIVLCPDSQPINLRTNISTNDQQFVQWQLSEDQGMNWTDLPNATDQSYVHDIFIPGQYFYRYLVAQSDVNLSNTKCRVVSDTTSIEILPIEFSISDTICEGAAYVIGSQSLSTTGVYIENLVGRRGCDSIVTLDLTVINDPGLQLEVDVQDPNCFQTNSGRITITNVVNGAAPFQYIFENDTVSEPSFTDLSAGLVTLHVFDRFLCEVEQDVSLVDPPEFIVDLGEDQFVQLGEEIAFDVMSNGNIIDYRWNTIPDQADCPNCDEVRLVPFDDIRFELIATDLNGCQSSDAISITVDKNYNVYIPNRMTPNGDGINDQFIIFAREGLIEEIETLTIFDRWGNLVFQTNQALVNVERSGWDGTFKTEVISTGSYAYAISVRFIDQSIQQFSGLITVVN